MKSIVVHFGVYEDWTPSVDAAIGLAKKLGAELKGLFTIREIAMLKLMLDNKHPAVREAEARDAVRIDRVRARFMQACEVAGVQASFDVGEGDAQELLCLVGRCHDLLVIEHARSGLDGIGGDSAEECAVACGTPTLIVPKEGVFNVVGKTIVIAWNNSRQAAAAVHGALPLIEAAEDVTVLLGEDRRAAQTVTRRPDADIAAYLRLYNENVTSVPFNYEGANLGLALQERTLDLGGDLLVMGAYGRSAWREFVFGGTTREIMNNLQLPVLMAH